MYNIVMLGAQGSGKGTQAVKMSDRLGIPSISTGNLFRAEAEKGTGLGREIATFIKRGELVPDQTVDQVMTERLSEEDTVRGVILDGYPRTMGQAEALDRIIGGLSRQITHVIYLTLSDEEAVKRLSGRRVCSNKHCETSYHIEFNPPKNNPGLCDRCGGNLVQREDDQPEAIARRLQLFHDGNNALVDFYRDKGILYEIDGEAAIEEIEERIFDVLGLG